MRQEDVMSIKHRRAELTRTNSIGSLGRTVQFTLASLVLVGGISAGSAIARTIVVEVAPPPVRYEVVPAQRHGYAWAPGYWAWQRNQYVWVNGHSMRGRSGYRWMPDHWNQVGNHHQFQAGHWTRGADQHGQ